MIKVGASGNAMLVLDTIKDDTSLLARETAMKRLSQELVMLASEQEKLRRERLAIEAQGDGSVTWLFALGLLAVGAGAGSIVKYLADVRQYANRGVYYMPEPNLALVIGGIIALVLAVPLLVVHGRLAPRAKAERETALAAHDTKLKELDAAIEAKQQQIAANKAEIDRLIAQM